MATKKIKFNSMQDVRDFVGIVSKYTGDCDVNLGSVEVDAKSILGMAYLQLDKELVFTYHCENEEDAKQIFDETSKWNA